MDYDVTICSPTGYFEVSEFYVHDDGERIRVLLCVGLDGADRYRFQVLHDFASNLELE